MEENAMARVRNDGALREIDRLFGEGTLAGLSDTGLVERYVAHRDELAFEGLVRRHGPMVLGICRRVLDDPNDADDAFQAAFLLLARKARSIRENGCVGAWLHRVAWRIALQLKSDAARRRDQERRAAERAAVGASMASSPWHDDTAAVIHEEIDRLPDRYRRPVVLCYLEELTYQQAADQLRWSEATTRGRLARARELLRARLTRRGVTLATAGLTLPAGTLPSPAATVPAALLQSAVRAARHIVLGESAAVSTTTIVLMKQAARTMMIARLKAIASAAFVVAALTGLAATGIGGDEPRFSGPGRVAKVEPAPRVIVGPAKEVEADAIAFHGHVMAPDGKPATGARVYTVAHRTGDDPARPIFRAKVNADGNYRFTIPRAEFDDATDGALSSTLIFLAAADGLGPDWIGLKKPTDEPINLRLVDDSVPISGRILDLQGRPVVGARVTRSRIDAEFTEDIDPYLKQLREDPWAASNHRFAKIYDGNHALPGQPSSIVTDGDGRFRLTGIGRDRIVSLMVEGPAIQSATITVMTRNAVAVSMPNDAFRPKTVHGATFDYLISPGRALMGVIRDKRTGQPLAGVRVAGKETNARTTTDLQGHYTLPGFPKGKSYGLMVLAGQNPPYFATAQVVSDTAGLDPIEANVDCVPGIPLRLKLIDRETGRPPKRAEVSYWPLYPNAHVREVPGFAPLQSSGAYSLGILQDDGTYLLGVLPGPGAVFVRTMEEGKYRPAGVDPEAFFKTPKKDEARNRDPHQFGDRRFLIMANGAGFSTSLQDAYNAIVLVNPPADSAPITAEAVLERDRKREVCVLDPDGKPLGDVIVVSTDTEATKTPNVFLVSKLNPMRPKRLMFHHMARRLAALLMARGDEAEPYTVRMQPWGTLTGRLVDAQGKPRPGATVRSTDWLDGSDDPTSGMVRDVKSDAEGHFRIEGLIPGLSHKVYASRGEAQKNGFGVVLDYVVLKPGETRDLGDVRAREGQ
jgi:RNA polymerase sigma factor (sigma-70 family)